MTVYKYELQIVDFQTLEIPDGYTLLSIQVQKGVPCLWATVDPDREKLQVKIRIAGTGHELKGNDGVYYIDTFQMRDGDLVFHAFEVRH